jgi:ATP dependent DNA ligase domain/HNH endonuclease
MDCAKHGQKRLFGNEHPLYKIDSRRKNRRGKHGAWARAVISRDHATCQTCGAQNVELHAHHIRPFVDHPELRWDINNGLTLCHRCHWDEHSKTAITEDRHSPTEGITSSGRAFRRWQGHCTECGAFISKRFSDVVGKSALFCKGDLCAWCFDLMELNGRALRRRTLIERKAMLRHLLNKADDHVLRLSETFADPVKLLAAANEQGLEGIVSKLSHQPYRSGKNPGWVKVKCHAWREANRDRGEKLQREH